MPVAEDPKALSKPYRIDDGSGFKLAKFAPNDTGSLSPKFKAKAEDALARGTELLTELQAKLYAQDRWSLLLVFQAPDAAGKDSTIKHVMRGIDPAGCQVVSFKAPTSTELDHDFLWRCSVNLPERGRIGIFNRSYYEEVLVVRVHPSILDGQKLPPTLVGKNIWKQRFEDIAAYERYLARQGTVIRKFFLNVSREEQRERFLARLDEPDKNWKFSVRDVEERKHWDAYQSAYEDMIRATSSVQAPWYVVPADRKWYTRLVVMAAVIDTLQSLDLAFPAIDGEKRAELEAVRKALSAEGA